MLEELKSQVSEANKSLVEHKLVAFTWGNVSGVDREKGLMAIKPSGVPYSSLKPEDIVLIDLETGKKVEGKLAPSSDAPTHLELYRAFGSIGGVTHTHSRWATSFAQAERPIIPFGTTHADCFYGFVPCTRRLSPAEIENDYEKNTGIVIAETFLNAKAQDVPAVLAACHGPFTWGKDAHDSVHNAAVLEEVAFMAFMTLALSPGKESIQQALMDKHFLRKHGANAYYGQIGTP
jgi:L-ribulose-5-phosphate 4-epimerase